MDRSSAFDIVFNIPRERIGICDASQPIYRHGGDGQEQQLFTERRFRAIRLGLLDKKHRSQFLFLGVGIKYFLKRLTRRRSLVPSFDYL